MRYTKYLSQPFDSANEGVSLSTITRYNKCLNDQNSRSHKKITKFYSLMPVNSSASLGLIATRRYGTTTNTPSCELFTDLPPILSPFSKNALERHRVHLAPMSSRSPVEDCSILSYHIFFIRRANGGGRERTKKERRRRNEGPGAGESHCASIQHREKIRGGLPQSAAT